MLRTIKASIDKDGKIELEEKVQLKSKRKALVTILEEETINEITLLSESSLSKDWDKPEEDEAWAHLQQAK